MGSRVVDLTPGWLKDWAVAHLGTNDKTVLLPPVFLVMHRPPPPSASRQVQADGRSDRRWAVQPRRPRRRREDTVLDPTKKSHF